MSSFKTVDWRGQEIILLDQRKLPFEETYFHCRTLDDVCEAIRNMTVRGAPAIGVTAALGVALAARQFSGMMKEFQPYMQHAMQRLAETRPTAVNLFWAISRMKKLLDACEGSPVRIVVEGLELEAAKLLDEDVECCRRLGHNGAKLLENGDTVMTHCNAGALATAGYGTALGVVRAAVDKGKKIRVIANETRPLLQGARLTAWELRKDKIPVTLITDNMAGAMLYQGKVQKIIVGADRIAANGDTANKIGTYTLAVLAKQHGIPFYVAAPISTIDGKTATGKKIPIEERRPEEVRQAYGKPIAEEGVPVYNPAFDVTPAELITAIITERAVLEPPYSESIAKVLEEEK